MDNRKKEILSKLLASEEDIFANLLALVEKSKSFFKVESKTGKILFNDPSSLVNINKLTLVLIGKYFAHELEIVKKKTLSLPELSEELNTPQTTLSKPLGILVKKGIVEKVEGEYSIFCHRISEILNEIGTKKSKNNIIRRRLPKRKIVNNGAIQSTPLITKHLCEKGGLDKFAEITGVTKEDLHAVFDFEENNINLLKFQQGNNEGEKHIHITLLLLTAHYYYFNEQEISSSELRSKLIDLGVRSLVNLSTHLRLYNTLLVHKKGKKGSNVTYYRITTPGLEMGRSLIRKLVAKPKEDELTLFTLGKRKRKNSGLGNEIRKLLDEGFFNNPVSVGNVKGELERRGFHNNRQEVDAYLRKVLLGKEVIRNKESGLWMYAIKK